MTPSPVKCRGYPSCNVHECDEWGDEWSYLTCKIHSPLRIRGASRRDSNLLPWRIYICPECGAEVVIKAGRISEKCPTCQIDVFRPIPSR